MGAVGLIGRDRVQGLDGDGGEGRVVAPRIEQGRLPVTGFWVQARDPRTTSRPGICSAFFLELNAVKGTSATSARDVQVPVGLVVDRVGVFDRCPPVLRYRCDGAFHRRIHPHRDRGLGPRGRGCGDAGVPVEGGIGTHEHRPVLPVRLRVEHASVIRR